LSALVDARVNLVAALGYTASKGKEAYLFFVAEDVVAARNTLRKAGYKQIKTVDVLKVSLANKPGAMQEVFAKLAAAGISIDYSYAAAATSKNATAIVRVKSMADKALRVLS